RSHRDHPLGYDSAVAVTTASPEPEASPAGRGIHRSNVGGVTHKGLSAHEHVTTIALSRDESERNLRHMGQKRFILGASMPVATSEILGKSRDPKGVKPTSSRPNG